MVFQKEIQLIMKLVRTFKLLLLLGIITTSGIYAQCDTWVGKPIQDDAEGAHSIYRTYLKGKTVADLDAMNEENFNIAFDNWKKVYDVAPAADGKRATHYRDGRSLYLSKIHREGKEKQKEYAPIILRLYDEQIQCYDNEAYLLGRKGFDMFYNLGYGYSKDTYETLKAAVNKGGNATEYIVFEPLVQVMVYLYSQKQLEKDEFIELYDKADMIIEHNKANNEQYGKYYGDTQLRLGTLMKDVESEIFDCEYFKKKLLPKYKDNPEDLDVIKYVYNKLKQEGCDETSEDLKELKTVYETKAAAINAEIEAKRRLENPIYDASQLQKEEKYSEAVARYKEGIQQSDDDEAKAQAYYSIAFIQGWKLGQYQSAVSSARKAASLKKGWGEPYILIGDIYGKGARGCGDDWNQRLAILAAIDKYRYARSIDPSVSANANKRIATYSKSKPEKAEGHMRGIKPGQKVKVGCWIGETVTVSFVD